MKLLAAVLLIASAGCGSAGAGTARVDGGATVRIVAITPLVVRGAGFRPHEKVTILVTPGAVRYAVRAAGSGTLLVRTAIVVKRCDAVVVQALGKGGSRAMVDRTVPTGCGDEDGPLPQ